MTNKYRESAQAYRLQSVKRRRDDPSYISLYDDLNCIMIVDMEKQNRGNIQWVSDSKLVSDLRISNTSNINDVIALPTVRHHKENLKKIDAYRYDF